MRARIYFRVFDLSIVAIELPANRMQTVTQHKPRRLTPVVVAMERGSAKVVVDREDFVGVVARVVVA